MPAAEAMAVITKSEDWPGLASRLLIKKSITHLKLPIEDAGRSVGHGYQRIKRGSLETAF